MAAYRLRFFSESESWNIHIAFSICALYVMREHPLRGRRSPSRGYTACTEDREVSNGEKFPQERQESDHGQNDSGIPIYVNPLGLQEANVRMDQAVFGVAGNIETNLETVLRTLNLGYDVRDGFLCVDSRQAVLESRVSRIEDKLDRLIKAMETGTARPRDK